MSIIVTSVMLGHVFFLSSLLGFIATRYTSGKSAGVPGRVRSIIFTLGRWKLHLHHWVCSSCLISVSYFTDFHLMTSTFTYGLLGGMVFQGIYCYDDWHRVLFRRHHSAA